ncbi:NUDIX domain-containing protein [Roseospira visakhapatnamensis]|uniref:GDP-mannose pyrophosphatase n=1 Tax=Roseospira visakhapatnamensis TaxID=390880 RepID=A0A7W6RAJ6_9PROT|nr:NUDIX hydrolase [Roseospira visakhapatnamensis]MBB4265000.1 8-oxo-dGTP pyrophosphatase MutT (NUDIX family) [Roseospira visakhapatnamensis]
MSNPWTTLSARPVYDNPWIQVTEFQVLTPAGTPGIYGVVHFKSRSVCILPIDDHGQVTLVGQYRYALKAWSWELPEGGCPVGTDPLLSARRELSEETGLEAAAWRDILDLHLSNSVTDETAVSFLAWDLTEGPARPEETERLTLRRVPFAEAVAMAERGAITDAHSVATLFRARLMAVNGDLPAPLQARLAY